jgi:hypothetical protein
MPRRIFMGNAGDAPASEPCTQPLSLPQRLAKKPKKNKGKKHRINREFYLNREKTMVAKSMCDLTLSRLRQSMLEEEIATLKASHASDSARAEETSSLLCKELAVTMRAANAHAAVAPTLWFGAGISPTASKRAAELVRSQVLEGISSKYRDHVHELNGELRTIKAQLASYDWMHED